MIQVPVPWPRVQRSPLFKSQSWSFGGTSVGTGQYTDAFQRAEFWSDAQPGGVNPSFGVKLAATTVPAVTVNVPSGYFAEYNASAHFGSVPCGNNLLGIVDAGWLQSYFQNTLIPSLASTGVGPNTLPVFVLHNVVAEDSTGCCILGWHGTFTNGSGAVQTYSFADYENSGAFDSAANTPIPGFWDTAILSHELAEWQNDPTGANPTMLWGNIGQVSKCQSNLEVGDPLTGTAIADTVGGFTYHLQEMAFSSWFYHQDLSSGVNGWYSNQGTFTSPAAQCGTISGVTFTGSSASPTITVTGTGLGAKSYLGTPQTPCGGFDTTGSDYGNNLIFSDPTGAWGAGQSCDALGLKIMSYSPTKIVFKFGNAYPGFGSVLAGDSYSVTVLGMTFSGTVAYT